MDTLIDKFLWGGKYPAPTQSLLQKWLRERHTIDITIMIIMESSYGVYLHKDRNTVKDAKGSHKEWIIHITPKNHLTGVYEEALEKGLQEALKLIE